MTEFAYRNYPITGVATGAAMVTPSDDDNLPFVARELYIGTGGDVSVEFENGDQVTYFNVPTAFYLKGFFVKVLSTGTDAEDIVAHR